MKVHLVSPFFPPSIGGLEKLLYNVAWTLRSADVPVVVHTMSRWRTEELQSTFECYFSGADIHQWVTSVSEELPRLCSSDDVVLFNSLGPRATEITILTMQKLRVSRCRVGFWVHTPDHLTRNLGHQAVPSFLRECDFVISNSKAVVERLSRMRICDVRHVPSFLLKSELLPPEARLPDQPRVAYMGRLVSRKRPELLLEIRKHLDPSVHMVVQGARSYGNDCRYDWFASRLRRFDRITLLPESLDPDDLVAQSRIFINPSVMETCSLALIEAMNRGQIPVVSSFRENADVVHALGLLVAGKSGAAFAAAVSQALGIPRRIQLEARERVRQNFSEGAVTETLLTSLT